MRWEVSVLCCWLASRNVWNVNYRHTPVLASEGTPSVCILSLTVLTHTHSHSPPDWASCELIRAHTFFTQWSYPPPGTDVRSALLIFQFDIAIDNIDFSFEHDASEEGIRFINSWKLRINIWRNEIQSNNAKIIIFAEPCTNLWIFSPGGGKGWEGQQNSQHWRLLLPKTSTSCVRQILANQIPFHCQVDLIHELDRDYGDTAMFQNNRISRYGL